MARMSGERTNIASSIRTTALPSGEPVPVLGQGTWHLGQGRHRRQEEIAALRLGIDLGLTLIDTAEMYGDGAAEQLVGEAIAGSARRRVPRQQGAAAPRDARRARSPRARPACGASPPTTSTSTCCTGAAACRCEETLDGVLDAARRPVTIRHWGVSNFDVADMAELSPAGRRRRGDQPGALQPRPPRRSSRTCCRGASRPRHPVMAYSPIEQGRLLDHPVLRAVAARHGATPAQVALAWVLGHDGVIAIPKAGTPPHVEENRAALRAEPDGGGPRRPRRRVPAAVRPLAATGPLTSAHARGRSLPPGAVVKTSASGVLLVDVAPAPVLAGLERAHDRVADGMRVPAGVAVGGRVAASDLAAGQAQPQVHPGRADPQALLTAFRRPWLHWTDEAQVRVGGHGDHAGRGRPHAGAVNLTATFPWRSCWSDLLKRLAPTEVTHVDPRSHHREPPARRGRAPLEQLRLPPRT